MPATSQSETRTCEGHPFERRQGLLEALASFSGFVLVLAAWYGLNIVMKLAALDVAP